MLHTINDFSFNASHRKRLLDRDGELMYPTQRGELRTMDDMKTLFERNPTPEKEPGFFRSLFSKV